MCLRNPSFPTAVSMRHFIFLCEITKDIKRFSIEVTLLRNSLSKLFQGNKKPHRARTLGTVARCHGHD